MTPHLPTPHLQRLDKAHLWHPFTPMSLWLDSDPLVIVAGQGMHLIDSDGRRYLDGVSSLWCNVHGHRVHEIDAAIRARAGKPKPPRPASKRGQLLEVLRTPKGISVEEIISRFAWTARDCGDALRLLAKQNGVGVTRGEDGRWRVARQRSINLRRCMNDETRYHALPMCGLPVLHRFNVDRILLTFSATLITLYKSPREHACGAVGSAGASHSRSVCGRRSYVE